MYCFPIVKRATSRIQWLSFFPMSVPTRRQNRRVGSNPIWRRGLKNAYAREIVRLTQCTPANKLTLWSSDTLVKGQSGASVISGSRAASASGEESFNMKTSSRMLRLHEVMSRTGLRKTTIYELQKSSNFPKGVPMTPRSVRWDEAEVNDWIQQRKLARSPAAE